MVVTRLLTYLPDLSSISIPRVTGGLLGYWRKSFCNPDMVKCRTTPITISKKSAPAKSSTGRDPAPHFSSRFELHFHSAGHWRIAGIPAKKFLQSRHGEVPGQLRYRDFLVAIEISLQSSEFDLSSMRMRLTFFYYEASTINAALQWQ